MWQESSETVQALRSGLTTGSCATACCVAACRALFKGEQPTSVEIQLPRGKTVNMALKSYRQLSSAEGRFGMRVAIVKDAGDDPDATHGATVFVELRLLNTTQKPANDNQNLPVITFKAASGVGTVTKTGLLLDIGEPAINPVPRRMMTEHLRKYAQTYQYTGDFEVAVGVENGEQIAKKTMNARLGILGGLSILGTTGIVRPYSCAAYIASIRQGVDVAASNGLTHIAASTGSSSELAIKQHYQLSETALIEMGDFVGALLKHLRQQVKLRQQQPLNSQLPSITKLSICGGFGKMTKLAQGALDLNSRQSSIDFVFLHNCVKKLLKIATPALLENHYEQLLTQILTANTSIEVLNLAQQHNLPLADYICYLAQKNSQAIVTKGVAKLLDVEVFAIDRKGNMIASYNAMIDKQLSALFDQDNTSTHVEE